MGRLSHVGLSRRQARPFLWLDFWSNQARTPNDWRERVQLSVDCLTSPEMLVPTHCIREFREVAARLLGRPNIILDATRNLTLRQLGHFGSAIARTRCLYHSLAEFSALANSESSSVVVTLKQEQDFVRLSHRPLDKRNKSMEL